MEINAKAIKLIFKPAIKLFCPEIIAGFGSEIFAILKFYIFSSGLAPTRANASDAI